MDLSSLNPVTLKTGNVLNRAARRNNVKAVKRLLTKMNPNCTDDRGWTCLHEAAANDSFESMILILQHRDCKPLAESHKGHTALHLACRYKRSLKTIQALLESVPDIANYGCNEQLTPLHMISGLGRIDCMELLIKYGAMVNVQDFIGYTPLHDAAQGMQPEAVNVLLHAGADSEIINEASYTPLHLACHKGCLQSVMNLIPFITDINMVTSNRDTALSLATKANHEQIVIYLLKHGADPNIKNSRGDIALTSTITMALVNLCKILIKVTDLNKLNKEIVKLACKPSYFNYEIVSLLLSNLGCEFFDYHVVSPIVPTIGEYNLAYLFHAPLNTYFNICEHVYQLSSDKFKYLFYLFLMKGLSVNTLLVKEIPPLVFIHLRTHEACFEEVFKILIEQGCNVDYCSSSWKERDNCIPDAFLISLIHNPSTAPIMMPYSLQCDPDFLLQFAHQNNVLDTIEPNVQETLLSMTGLKNIRVPLESFPNVVFPLKHLTRLKIRHVLRKNRGIEKSTHQFFKTLDKIQLPHILKNYLRYY